MKTPENKYEIARDAAEKGIAAIPILPGTKVPAVKWKRFQSELPSRELLHEWFLDRTRYNIAIITTGMVLFDVDDLAEAELVLRECGDTPHKLKTPRGIHLGYRKRSGVNVRNQVKIKGHAIDIRTNGGLEIIPSSETEHGRYEWIGEGLRRVCDLPVARISWTRVRTRKRIVENIERCAEDVMARRARGYLATIEGAISGNRGHDRTFRVACTLTHKFGLTFEEAWPLFKEWSEIQCEPPWSDRELEHKLRDAQKNR